MVIFGPLVRGPWHIPACGKPRSTLEPVRWLPPKKSGAGGRAASLAALFWAALHAIASSAPQRGAVLDFSAKLLETIRTDLCASYARATAIGLCVSELLSVA